MPVHPLITQLAVAEGLPRQEIQACRAQREEMLPIFIDVLRRGAGGDLAVEEYDALFFILHLLGEFADPAACQPLLEFLASDPVQVEDIIGDAITETLPGILISVYDGDHNALEAFIGNLTVDQFVRGAVFDAWVYHVLSGRIDRDHAEAYLREFSLPEGDEHEALWTTWLTAIAYLEMDSLFERAREACRDELVDPRDMNFADFERLSSDVKTSGDPLSVLAAHHRAPFTDTIAELSHWHAFSEAYLREQRRHGIAGLRGETVVNPHRHVGRNDPCPCGSGKKFKKCCGA